MQCQQLVAEMDQARESIQKNGYVERSADISSYEYAREKLRQRTQAAKDEPSGSDIATDEKTAAAFTLDSESVSRLPFPLSAVPTGFVHTESENFVIPAGPQITRLYSDTELGTLLIQEFQNGQVDARPQVEAGGLPAQQLIAAGFPVYVTIVKYFGEKWTTVAVTGNGHKAFYIEVGTRINEPKSESRLVALLSSLLTT